MKSGLADLRIIIALVLLFAWACRESRLTKADLVGAKEKASQKSDERPIEQTTLPSSDLDMEMEPNENGSGSPIAQEPVPIGGAYLIDPAQVKNDKSGSTVDMQGAAGSIKPVSDAKLSDATIELLAFDPDSTPANVTPTAADLAVTVLASTPVAQDGSFRLVADIPSRHWIFLRVPAADAAPLKVDTTRNEAGLAWVDNEGTLRRLDQAVAYTIRGIVSPTDDLKGAVARLITTKSCRNCNLAGASFNLLDLSNSDLTGANLMGARFVGANVSMSAFVRADLRGADFRRANVSLSDFRNARLDGILLQGANRDGTNGLNPPP